MSDQLRQVERECCLVVLKPDCVARGLIGEAITKLERAGLKIIKMDMRTASKELAQKHYAELREKYSEKIFNEVVEFLTSGPVVAMVFVGIDACNVIRKLIGSTYPNEATPGTFRGDYCHISKKYSRKTDTTVMNLIHASASAEEARNEICLWFPQIKEEKYARADEVYHWGTTGDW